MESIEYRNWIGSKIKVNEEILQLTQEECRNVGLTNKDIIDSNKPTMDKLIAQKILDLALEKGTGRKMSL